MLLNYPIIHCILQTVLFCFQLKAGVNPTLAGIAGFARKTLERMFVHAMQGSWDRTANVSKL